MSTRKTYAEMNRDLTVLALSQVADMNSASRLQIYDYVFERLLTNLSEGSQQPTTEAELAALFEEAAIRFDF